MGNHLPLTQAQKEYIYREKLAGRTLAVLAEKIDCSIHCVRKWWRVGRNQGLEGLRRVRRGRGPSKGVLSRFSPEVAERAVALKRAHPGWGAKRVRIALQQDTTLQGLPLPGPSRLATLFKEQCPECVATRKVRKPSVAALPPAITAHEVWQLDSQEGIVLANGDIATICNIRDPVGAAMIASRAFSVPTEKRWRKLTWTEVREVLRQGFTEWRTLPDEVRTDNELGLAGGPNDPFPGKLTLWIVGLGVRHRCIRPGRPTDQPQIERNHRTLNGLAFSAAALADLEHLQQALDGERQVYNTAYPSQASDCAGRSPLTAHPELLQPRRYYDPSMELGLFDLQRVYDYLSTFTFKRTINASAQVSLGRTFYSLGKSFIREQAITTVMVRFDPQTGEWVFCSEDGVELTRRPLKGLDVPTLTGLDSTHVQETPVVQLTLPFLIPAG